MDSRSEHAYALVVGDGDGDSAALAETLVALAERVALALDVWECCIYELLGDSQALRAQAIWSQRLTKEDRAWVGQVNHLTDLPGFDAVVERRDILVSYPEDEADAVMEGPESMAYWGELAALYAPIVHGDEVFGILELTETRERREFSVADRRLVEQVAGLAALALANARESRAARARNRQLSALIDSSRAMTSTLDLDEVLEVVCRQAATALDAPCSYIYEYDAVADEMIWLAHYQRDPEHAFDEPLGTRYPLDDMPQDREVIETRSAVQVSLADPELDPVVRGQLGEWGEQASLMVPLVVGEHVVGALEVSETSYPRSFSAEESALAKALGEQAAVAIRNAQLFRRVQDQSRQKQALLDSSRAISSTVVLEEVLERVGEQAARAVDAPSCYIYEYDRRNDAIIWRSHFQADDSYGTGDPLGTAYPLDDYPWDRAVLRSGTPQHVLGDDETLEPTLRASMAEWRERTLLTVPLMFRGAPVGLMELAETRYARRFTADEIDLAKAIGEQAAVAIHNAQLYRREQWRNERLVRVLDISRAVSSSLDAEAVAAGLRAQVGRLFPDKQAEALVHLLPAGARVGDDAGPPGVGRDDALLLASLRSMTPAQAPCGAAHRLVVPLVQKNLVGGYIEIVGGGPGGFESDEIELVQLLANQAAASVDNARLYETIERQATIDDLTGLYNHRHFFERLQDETVRARRYGFALSVLMLDLDDFKHFNDRYGHPAGDRVLHVIGEIVRRQVRDGIDVPARYGGEEFSVILPHTPVQTAGSGMGDWTATGRADPDAAHVHGERLRRSIADADLPLDEHGRPARVTASVGVATLAGDAADADELVSRADQALYVAKERGKNRVETFSLS